MIYLQGFIVTSALPLGFHPSTWCIVRPPSGQSNICHSLQAVDTLEIVTHKFKNPFHQLTLTWITNIWLQSLVQFLHLELPLQNWVLIGFEPPHIYQVFNNIPIQLGLYIFEII